MRGIPVNPRCGVTPNDEIPLLDVLLRLGRWRAIFDIQPRLVFRHVVESRFRDRDFLMLSERPTLNSLVEELANRGICECLLVIPTKQRTCRDNTVRCRR